MTPVSPLSPGLIFQDATAVSEKPCKPSLDSKIPPPPCQVCVFFQNKYSVPHRYKGTVLVQSVVLRYNARSSQSLDVPIKASCEPSPRRAQMSVLILSSELSIFVRVFLMRKAVSRAEGFWYQHSFISLARDDKVWKHRGVNVRSSQRVYYLQFFNRIPSPLYCQLVLGDLSCDISFMTHRVTKSVSW